MKIEMREYDPWDGGRNPYASLQDGLLNGKIRTTYPENGIPRIARNPYLHVLEEKITKGQRLTEGDAVLLVQVDAYLLSHLPQTHATISAAINNMPHSFRCVTNPSTKIQGMAVEIFPGLIRYIRSPSKKMCKYAIANDYDVINFIKDPPLDLIKLHLRSHKCSLYELNFSQLHGIDFDDLLRIYLEKWGKIYLPSSQKCSLWTGGPDYKDTVKLTKEQYKEKINYNPLHAFCMWNLTLEDFKTISKSSHVIPEYFHANTEEYIKENIQEYYFQHNIMRKKGLPDVVFLN